MRWWRRGSAEARPTRDWAETDFYALLDVTPEATTDEIKRAARLRLRQFVPDNPAAPADADQQYIATHEALEVLLDPLLRREYDNMRRHVGSNDDARAVQAPESK